MCGATLFSTHDNQSHRQKSSEEHQINIQTITHTEQKNIIAATYPPGGPVSAALSDQRDAVGSLV